MKYRVLAEKLTVCRLAPDSAVPEWCLTGGFFCLARTADELSVVCEEDRVPEEVRVTSQVEIKAEKGWVALKLEGPFPFSMTGVLTSFLQPLAGAGIPVFAISTFETDYVLVKQEILHRALETLANAGHERKL